jgi:hypothetical protein
VIPAQSAVRPAGCNDSLVEVQAHRLSHQLADRWRPR